MYAQNYNINSILIANGRRNIYGNLNFAGETAANS